jgi:hypothetical protein
MELQIADINLVMPVQDFESELQDCINNYHGAQMNYGLKAMSTKRGKNMYKLTVDHDGSSIDIVAERDDVSGDICFHPLKLQNFNDSFYKVFYSDTDIMGQDEDPCMFITYALRELCNKHKGSFAYIDPNDHKVIIKDGSAKRAVSIALIDNDGNVYSCAGAKSIKGASESSSFSVNKPIGDWLNENLDVKREIAKLSSMDEKMNYIGKYLINAKVKEEIDSDEFMDIFCQAGIIGFSEPSVLNIYKLIM